MKRTEYLHGSMYGSYWVPCEVIREDENGNLTIVFTDGVINEKVEREVKADSIRWIDDRINDNLLNEASVAAALVFRDAIAELDVAQLEEIANIVKSALADHFYV